MTSLANGLFGVNSASIRLRGLRRHAVGPTFRNATTRIHGARGLRMQADDEAIDWGAMTEEERLAYLTALHENDHFSTAVGSPLGLLLWRCSETLLDDTVRLLRDLEACGVKRMPPGKHLLDWFYEDGQKFLDEQAEAGRLPPPSDTLRYIYGAGEDPDKDTKNRILRDGLTGLADEIHFLERFLELLFGPERPKVTMGAFINLADEAFACLARRWNFPQDVTWDTRYPREGPLYPPPDVNWSITCLEMFEASARLRERGFLEGAGADQAAIQTWEQRNIAGVYKPGYQFLREKFSDTAVAHHIAQLSLTTPIDIACHQPPRASHVFVEDVLPGFRAARLLMALMQALPGHDDGSLEKEIEAVGLPDVLCRAAGLRTATDTIESVQAYGFSLIYALSPLAERTGGGGEPNPGGLCDYTRYTTPILRKFKIGMRQNLHNLLPKKRIILAHLTGGLFIDTERFGEAMQDKDRKYPVQPDVTYHGDYASLNSAYKGKDAFIYADSVVHYITTQACLGLLHPRRAMQDPGPLLRAFANRLKSGGEELDLGDLANTPLGRAMKAEHEAEQALEWRSQRKAWGSPDESYARIRSYLRGVFGNAAMDSLRFYD